MLRPFIDVVAIAEAAGVVDDADDAEDEHVLLFWFVQPIFMMAKVRLNVSDVVSWRRRISLSLLCFYLNWILQPLMNRLSKVEIMAIAINNIAALSSTSKGGRQKMGNYSVVLHY